MSKSKQGAAVPEPVASQIKRTQMTGAKIRMRLFGAVLVISAGFAGYKALVWMVVGESYLPANHRDLELARAAAFERLETAGEARSAASK